MTELERMVKRVTRERRPVPLNPRPLDEMDIAIIRGLAANGMSVTETAKETYFARRTIYYRIEVIENKTGLNPLDFYDLLALLVQADNGKLKTKRYCEDCGMAYEGGPKSQYCPDCRKERLSDTAKKRGLCYMGGAANAAKKGKTKK